MASAAFLLLALILSPIIGGGLGELTNAILQILIFSGIALHIFVSRKGSGGLARVPGFIVLAAAAVIVLISTFFTQAVYYSLTHISFLFACLGAYILTASIARDKKIATIAVWGVAMSALVICMLGIRHYAFSVGGGAEFWKSLTSSGDHMRLFGPFVNPGFFAGYLVITLPITLGIYLVTKRSVLAVLAGMAFTVEMLALMLTGAKFGIISAVAALLVFFILAIATKSLRRSRFKRLIVIAVIALPLMCLFNAPVKSRIQAAESGGSQVHSTAFRIYTWKATLHMVKDHPLVGVGPGCYAIAYPRYTIAGPTKFAHSSYLQFAADNGAVAFITLLLALGMIAYSSVYAIVKGGGVVSDHANVSDEPLSDAITWKDLVPYSAWRLLNCAMFASLVGSGIRSLVDSDWYVIGIALPFWVLAGVLVAQSGAVSEELYSRKPVKIGVVVILAALTLICVSGGLGDLFANRAASIEESDPGNTDAIIDAYRHAEALSPLNPDYHRKLGLYYGITWNDLNAGESEFHSATRLSPRSAENWYSWALMISTTKGPRQAIPLLKTALKCNPNSTQSLQMMATLYTAENDMKSCEAVLNRLIEIENSPYEQIKGTPEIVDTTFARAHAYFANKYLARGEYEAAINEYTSAIERLERWRSNDQMLMVTKLMGKLTTAEEQDLLQLLRRCYLGLAEADLKINDKSGAVKAGNKAEKIRIVDGE